MQQPIFGCTRLATAAAAATTSSISGVVGWAVWKLSHRIAVDLDGVPRSAVEDAAVAIPPEVMCLADGNSGVGVATALHV